MKQFSDHHCIMRSLDEPELFGELFRRHGPALLRYLTLRVGDRHAEDLTAEAFVRAFDARAQFRPLYDSALPWLYGIAANLIREQRKKEARAARALARHPAPQVGPAVEPQFGAAMDKLRKLPLAMRETVLLWVWADLDYAQIAVALDVAPGTVASRISRVRDLLGDEHADAADPPSAPCHFPTLEQARA